MASALFNRGKKLILDSTLNLTSDTINVALMCDQFTFDADINYMDHISISAGEYAYTLSGAYARQTLGNKAIAQYDAGDYAKFSADNVLFSNVIDSFAPPSACIGVVIYKHVGSDDSNNPVIAYVEITNLHLDGQDLEVKWDANGIIHIT